MSDLKRQMLEDRAVRDAAKALIDADIAHVKNTFSGPSLTERAATNLNEGAREVFDKASSAADNHKGILAALIGAVLIWFARNPILSLFEEQDAGKQEPLGETDNVE
ncbi:hypothetical protein [Altererythrobacter lutimaris]|uniref:Uncharacterized protein n=1 Tax=Altererythrobacter lutimaris TaxID=2743979 RepID=A0A850HGC6_9SPHN|nr:hypothetical protein [Altererythrobacter lutimaris]NVE93732.1 hypothetical protein [Altererythrobacter lutimaris]